MSEMTNTLLEMQNVSKEYNGNPVLKDVNFTLKEGEVLGLVGENGAGKSTLMNILFGMDVIQQTGGYGGKVLIDGKEVKFASPLDALKAGIGMVHQEFMLVPSLTIAENMVLHEEPRKGIFIDNDGSRTEVGPGDVCCIEVGQSHGMENASDEDLV